MNAASEKLFYKEAQASPYASSLIEGRVGCTECHALQFSNFDSSKNYILVYTARPENRRIIVHQKGPSDRLPGSGATRISRSRISGGKSGTVYILDPYKPL